jgi:hypothetical protein
MTLNFESSLRWCWCVLVGGVIVAGSTFTSTKHSKTERKVVVQSNGLINLLQLTTILYFL